MKIAILGSAPSSNKLAPFGDLSWTIWACSPGNMGVLPRIDRFYELHNFENVIAEPSYGPYVLWMRSLKEISLIERHPKFPNSITYPIDEVKDNFCWDFFTSSVAYMLAEAILTEGVEEIGLWGVDMNATDEYSDQRPGCKYFIELARNRGIKITVPMESDLLKVSPPYGFKEMDPTWTKLQARRKELVAIREQLVSRIAEDSRSLTAHNAAIDMLDYVVNTHVEIWRK